MIFYFLFLKYYMKEGVKFSVKLDKWFMDTILGIYIEIQTFELQQSNQLLHQQNEAHTFTYTHNHNSHTNIFWKALNHD